MLNLYKTVSIPFHPPTTFTAHPIVLARARGSYDRSKNVARPLRTDRLAQDERQYAKEYLSTASSVHVLDSPDHPRTFIWRLTSNNKFLEIWCADLALQNGKVPANVVLAFEFQDEVIPRTVRSCGSVSSEIAAKEVASFHIICATRTNEVYEIALKPDYFIDVKTIPKDAQTWVRTRALSTLSTNTVYQLHAQRASETIVVFTSGAFELWHQDEHGVKEKEVYFDERTWRGTIRSLVSRGGPSDVDFEGAKVSVSAAQSAVRVGNYVVTSCLDHKLRVWDITTARIRTTVDLQNLTRAPNEKIQLGPGETGFLQVLTDTRKVKERDIVCSYSPLDGGQVKFWRVRNVAQEVTDDLLEDMFPNTVLQLPDPDPTGNGVWSLAGLRVVEVQHERVGLQMWVMWQSHHAQKVYSLKFDWQTLTEDWQDNWVGVLDDGINLDAPDFVLTTPEDATQNWLKHLFYVSPVASAAVETALNKFCSALNVKLSSKDRKGSLRARLRVAIESQVPSAQPDDVQNNSEYRAQETDQQWRKFYQILLDLEKMREAPVTMTASSTRNQAWILKADTICAIGEAADIDLEMRNDLGDLKDAQRLVKLHLQNRKFDGTNKDIKGVITVLNAARKFYQSFPLKLQNALQEAYDVDMFSQSEEFHPERVIEIFNEVDFANSVSADAEQELSSDLDTTTNSGGITTRTITIALAGIEGHLSDVRGRAGTEFGMGATFSQNLLKQDVQKVRQILLEILAFLVYVDESDTLQSVQLYHNAVNRLKTQERNLWLLMHSTKEGGPIVDAVFDKEVSVLESQSLPAAIRSLGSHRFAQLSTLRINRDLDQDEAYIQAFLLSQNEIDLAVNFKKFVPPSPRADYLEGRLHLLQGRYEDARSSFLARSSEDMASPKKAQNLSITQLTAGLIDEADAKHFHSGRPAYLSHILTLFERVKAFPQAIAVATEAISAAERKEPYDGFVQELRVRALHIQLAQSEFNDAFETLFDIESSSTQKSCCTLLIDAVLDPNLPQSTTSKAVKLQSLPWSDQPYLALHLDRHLYRLSQRQTSLPQIGGSGTNPYGQTPAKIRSAQKFTTNNMDYLSILIHIRLVRKDYRGASQLLFTRLKLVQKSSKARADPQATAIRHATLALINCMVCIEEDGRYLIINAEDDPRAMSQPRAGMKRLREQLDYTNLSSSSSSPVKPRTVITLEDLRRQYQRILDRCSRMEKGDFEFNGNDFDDSEEEDETYGTGDDADAHDLNDQNGHKDRNADEDKDMTMYEGSKLGPDPFGHQKQINTNANNRPGSGRASGGGAMARSKDMDISLMSGGLAEGDSSRVDEDRMEE